MTLFKPSQTAFRLPIIAMASTNLGSYRAEDVDHVEPIGISQPAGVTKLFEDNKLVLVPAPTDDPDGKC